jgi:hypothetical protein
MPQWGPKSRRERSGYKATPKGLADAQREVRGLVVATTRRESGATCVRTARDGWACESGLIGCEGGPQAWEPQRATSLSTDLEAR